MAEDLSEHAVENAIDTIIDTTEEEDTGENSGYHWHKGVALTSLLLAVISSIGGLLAGMTAQDALLERTRDTIEIAVIEGDRVIVEILKSKHETFRALGREIDEAELKMVHDYEKKADRKEHEMELQEEHVQHVSHAHHIFAITVTILGVAVSLCGIAILSNLKWIWYTGLLFSMGGVCFFINGLLLMF